MQTKNIFKSGLLILATTFILAGCGGDNKKEETSLLTDTSTSEVKKEVKKVNSEEKSSENKEESKSTKKSTTSEQKKAERAAETVLNYMYQNKGSGLEKVVGVSGTNLTRILEDTVYEAKITDYPGNDWLLVVNENIYTAEDIFRQYSKVYVKGFKQIHDYKITDVEVDEDVATVKFSIDPLAMRSITNAVTWTRLNIYGGLEVSELIEKSQNPDVKAINNLLKFKLFDIIYGDKAIPMSQVGEDIELEFTLEKDGDSYRTDSETVVDLMKQSQISEYAKESSNESQEKILDDKIDGTEL